MKSGESFFYSQYAWNLLMEKWGLGIGLLFLLSLMFWLIETHRVWSTIFLLLAIIFYALFANPMQRVHQATFGEDENRPKRKLKRKKA